MKYFRNIPSILRCYVGNLLRDYGHLEFSKIRFFFLHFLKVYHLKNVVSKFDRNWSIFNGDTRIKPNRIQTN